MLLCCDSTTTGATAGNETEKSGKPPQRAWKWKSPVWWNMGLWFYVHLPFIACQMQLIPSRVHSVKKKIYINKWQGRWKSKTSVSPVGTIIAKKIKQKKVSASVSVFLNRNATILIDGLSEVIFSLDSTQKMCLHRPETSIQTL